MGTSRAKQEVLLRRPGTPVSHGVRLALLLRRDAWAFRPLFSGASESPASSSPRPPGFTDVSEGGCHRCLRSLVTNSLATTVYENPVPLAAQL